MGAETNIEWTDATWNPIGGCEIASPGCINCYAQRLAGTRLKHHPLYAGTTKVVKGKPVFNGHLTVADDDADVWTWPLRWKGAKNPVMGAGKPSLIFVGDMSDLFHAKRPATDVQRVVDTIILGRHIAQLLTKRADIMLAQMGRYRPTDQLWLGFSAERQKEFDERWEHVRELAAIGWIIFVSIEPMLELVELPADFLALGDRAQVIVGGESGREAREPPDPRWIIALRDACVAAGVRFFFKQWGEFVPDGQQAANGHTVRTSLSDAKFVRFGKKRAGRKLDGVEWTQFPRMAA